MNTKKNKIEFVIIIYVAFSLIAALISPHIKIQEEIISGISRIPTIKTLSGHGEIPNGGISLYFLSMFFMFPVCTTLIYSLYEGGLFYNFSMKRAMASLLFLISSILMFVWFIFFISPATDVKGTRMRVFIYLSSNTEIGLGIIYGGIFVSLSLLIVILVDFLKIMTFGKPYKD